MGDFGSSFRRFGSYGRSSPRVSKRPLSRAPAAALILLAGLAAFAYARLFTAANRSTGSKVEKVLLGLGLAAVGTLLRSIRRSGARYRW
jgi:hypothetical protein